MSIARRTAKNAKVRRTLISIERQNAKNAKVRKDLNVPPCGSRAIKVLAALKKGRNKALYRH